VPVSERVRMFETRSTPCLRSAGGVPTHSQSRVHVSHTMVGQVATPASLFTPLRGSMNGSSTGMKPKELFRSQSELVRASRQAPQFVRTGVGKPQAVANSTGGSASVFPGLVHPDSSSVQAFERLASGCRRDDVAKPKSLKAAELAKQQERERERARSGANPINSTAAPAHVIGPPSNSGPLSARDVKPRKAVPPPAQQTLTLPLPAPTLTAQGRTEDRTALNVPPVPVFAPEPHMQLRRRELAPKKDEDNYEISDHDPDSDNEDEKRKENRDRARTHKPVPRWCETYLQELMEHADIDPDSIFAHRVPHCELDVIFPEVLYQEVGRHRPKRMRGSSGDWRKDRLTCAEIRNYKSRMGHTRAWDAPNKAPLSATQAPAG